MRILIADKQYLIGEGIKSVLQKQGKYTFGFVTDRAGLFPKSHYSGTVDCIIIDFDTVNDFEVNEMHILRDEYPETKLFVLTNNENEVEINLCLEVGVDGYVLKNVSKEVFIESFEDVIAGKKSYCQQVLNILCNQFITSKKKINEPEEPTLTPQEIKIAQLAAWGLTAKEMSSKLNISIHTVNTHRKNIFKKLGINNVSELVMYAMRKGLIDTTEYYI